MKKQERKQKASAEMNEAELVRVAAEFDREFVADSFRTATPTAQAKWRKAKRKRGRPRQGKGAKVISLSLERGLLARCDRVARKKGISRASMIARGLAAVLANEE